MGGKIQESCNWNVKRSLQVYIKVNNLWRSKKLELKVEDYGKVVRQVEDRKKSKFLPLSIAKKIEIISGQQSKINWRGK